MTAPQTDDDSTSARYTAAHLDAIAQAIESAADADAEFDPAPELTAWAAKRANPPGSEQARDVGAVIEARRARRAGTAGDDPVGQARTVRRERRGA